MNKLAYYKEQIYKIASEDDFDENGKIPALEKAFSNSIEKKVAYMIATSHEYKKPNVKAALSFVKNYKWELSTCKLCNMQGINKPVNEEKVADMAKNMKKVEPFIVVNQFHGIRPQTPGKKILIDGHHRHKACEAQGRNEVAVYKGTYTGNAEKPIEELREKTAAEIEGNFYYHASPVQGIKKFRYSEDTSGNNKGKVVFASKEPSFSAAFGIRWNDGTARLSVQTKDKKVPTNSNYAGTVLRYTEKVNIDAPCSMYKLKGNFKSLRYSDDIESYTSDDIEIISEEQFSSFKDMAKAYGLDLRSVTDKYVINNLKSKKSSNFEKKAMEKQAATIKPYIVAVDFDGTIKKDPDMNVYDELQPGCKDTLEFLKRLGCTIILWTCRSGKELDKALAYLRDMEVIDYFDKVNENADGMFQTSNKIFANYYVDDRNIGGFVGWAKVKKIVLEDFLKQQSPTTLSQLVKSVEKEKGSRDAEKLVQYVQNNAHKLEE